MTPTTLPPHDQDAASRVRVAPHGAAPIARSAGLLAALAAALAWNVVQVGAGTSDGALVAPPLTLPEPRCGLGAAEPEELAARSAQLATAARARIDRYPFRPAEGLPALRLLSEASACAAQSGAETGAAALRAEARRFHRRLESDRRDRLLRVERALAGGEPRRARADIEALAAQVEGEDHAFARRIRNLRAGLADGENR